VLDRGRVAGTRREWGLANAWTAIVKPVRTVAALEPCVTRAPTVTSSPGLNGRPGTKLAPAPVE
jgi:hypothetical protein